MKHVSTSARYLRVASATLQFTTFGDAREFNNDMGFEGGGEGMN